MSMSVMRRSDQPSMPSHPLFYPSLPIVLCRPLPHPHISLSRTSLERDITKTHGTNVKSILHIHIHNYQYTTYVCVYFHDVVATQIAPLWARCSKVFLAHGTGILARARSDQSQPPLRHPPPPGQEEAIVVATKGQLDLSPSRPSESSQTRRAGGSFCVRYSWRSVFG